MVHPPQRRVPPVTRRARLGGQDLCAPAHPCAAAAHWHACGEVAGAARRIAADRLSRPLAGALDTVFGEPELIDADALLLPEKMVKTAEEIACLRRAQALTEAAMERVVEHIVPGVREVDLTGMFLAEMAALGVTTCRVEPVWCALPRAAAAAPWTLPGGLPYRELTGTRPLEEGDLVAIDTAILYEGYMSDFGRTWYCTAGRGRPSVARRDLFRRWQEIAAVVTEACRPGATGAALRRAAVRVAGREPWPQPLYLAHGIGLGGVEPPFIGTDLGEAAEERMVL